MSKYGRENRRRTNKESARVGEVFLPWVAPQGPTTEITSALYLGGFLYAQREIRLESNGMLVEFAIVVSKDTPKGRREIFCIDNCHQNNVHKHLNNHAEYTVLKELLFEGDLDSAFATAIDEATNFCSDQIGGNDD